MLTGFAMLASQGLLRFSQEMAPRPPILATGPFHCRDKASWMIDVEIDGKRRAYIDLHEGTEIDVTGYESCDVYFKRSLVRTRVPVGYESKLRPFGLLHDVSLGGFDRFELWRQCHADARVGAKISEISRWIRRPLLAALGRGDRLSLDESVAAPEYAAPQRAFFMTSVYDPEPYRSSGPDVAADYESMNEMRVQCVRMLRRELGARFLGGIQPSAYALRTFPDVVVTDPRMIRLRELVNVIQKYPVCVATSAPRRCPGFMPAAYAALSRAIVSESFPVELPGAFHPDVNYLPFETPVQCVDQVSRLLEEPDRIQAQMRANWDYFTNWLRPDALVMRIVRTTLERD